MSKPAPLFNLYDMPHNYEAERCLLSMVLLNTTAMDEIVDVLGDDTTVIYDPVHRNMWEAMLAIWKHGDTIDEVSLPAALESHMTHNEVMDAIGGVISATSTSFNTAFYANQILEKALKRQAMEAAYQLFYDSPKAENANAVIEYAEAALLKLTETTARKKAIPLAASVPKVVEDHERLATLNGQITGIPSGLGELDKLTGGFQPGNLIILAARPGVGKSAFALNIAHHAAAHDWPVLFFSLEMSIDELTGRFLSIAGGSDMSRIRSGWQAQPEIAKERAIMPQVMQLMVDINDEPDQTIMSIRGEAQRFARKHKRGLIVVDYLQLINSESSRKQRYEQVAELSRGLHSLARKTGMPILCLAQLSREAETITDVFQKMRCLRESGSLEQDADLVLILDPVNDTDLKNWKNKKVSFTEEQKNRMNKIALAKHRGGPTGLVLLQFDKPTQRFKSITTKDPEGAGYEADSYDDDPYAGNEQQQIDDNTF